MTKEQFSDLFESALRDSLPMITKLAGDSGHLDAPAVAAAVGSSLLSFVEDLFRISHASHVADVASAAAPTEAPAAVDHLHSTTRG